MATYAIGDIQGCCDEFEDLLEKIHFDPARDRLWLVGDLINRGPRSLDVIRKVRELGDAAVSVLGNHDLHLLAVRYGGHTPKPGDTFDEVLTVAEGDEICEWLRHLPLLHQDPGLGYVMSHAGVPHIWSLEQAIERAREVESVMQGPRCREYFAGMYGNEPDLWDDALEGMDRWRVITNYFTRMRLVDAQGRLDFAHKGALADAPPGWYPWYELRARFPLGAKVVFGHWAALEGHTGVADAIALDTGCVWGRSLTALCLETGEMFAVPARGRES
ncbi:MAG: symmetrical bis(5'-nucleosyl)-tetraphosphatase [Gammaproteobacteria bacterium]|jgi:bis(5'-nucleosyl)-tetraphosphatase (symmetrical)|nr:symmetrical bis(5'-nucleosyl)-tetraphosphatase [Gammaproteobacteria bacterium]